MSALQKHHEASEGALVGSMGFCAEGNLDASFIDACSGSRMESSASHSLKTSRWLQLGMEEGQVEQRYLVIPHTLVHFMSPWFVPSYTPTRNGSVPPWQISPGDRRDTRERTWMQIGKCWLSNLRSGLKAKIVYSVGHFGKWLPLRSKGKSAMAL